MIKTISKNRPISTGAVAMFTYMYSAPPVLLTSFEQMKCQHRSSVNNGIK